MRVSEGMEAALNGELIQRYNVQSSRVLTNPFVLGAFLLDVLSQLLFVPPCVHIKGELTPVRENCTHPNSCGRDIHFILLLLMWHRKRALIFGSK